MTLSKFNSLNMATIKLPSSLTDESILAKMGQRIARRRLRLKYTQANVAEQAGVAKRTVERIEAGGSTQTATLIRILRVLDLLTGLDHMIPADEPSPMDLLKRKGKKRQRASSRRPSEESHQPWTWDDAS